MKANTFTLIILSVLLAITACKKDEDPPVVLVKPTLIFSDNNPEFLGSSTINWNANGDDYNKFSVTVNGVEVSDEKFGSYVLDSITTTQTVFVLCFKKGQNDPVAVQGQITPRDPLLTLSIVPDQITIFKGQTILLDWTSNGEVTCTEIPAVSGKSGQTRINPEITTTYHFTSTFYGFTKKCDVTVIVNDPLPPTRKDTLSNFGPWSMVKLRFQDGPGLPWYEANIWECRQDNLMTFSQNPDKVLYDRGEIRCSDDETRLESTDFTLVENILTTGQIYEIITLTQDTLIWRYHPGGSVTQTEETFVHPDL